MFDTLISVLESENYRLEAIDTGAKHEMTLRITKLNGCGVESNHLSITVEKRDLERFAVCLTNALKV